MECEKVDENNYCITILIGLESTIFNEVEDDSRSPDLIDKQKHLAILENFEPQAEPPSSEVLNFTTDSASLLIDEIFYVIRLDWSGCGHEPVNTVSASKRQFLPLTYETFEYSLKTPDYFERFTISDGRRR
ncbi:hypothetical protein DICVIV_00447 [Dictyocaulus viviparus]|uniref:Uncharacterized protein n=1 Tax=Dictyocaulus viviparus TaxID=29172 RepID=A0A0D8YBD5_DICVI|nr:hypothetical protein DICVIV_00447 [Dictyocaulus viviparus]